MTARQKLSAATEFLNSDEKDDTEVVHRLLVSLIDSQHLREFLQQVGPLVGRQRHACTDGTLEAESSGESES